MNRIDQKFKELRAGKRKAFIAFTTAGDPSLSVTEELVLAFEKAGTDIVELGIPFSDPLADGPTIQAASQRALKQHVNVAKIFHLVGRIRRRSNIPLALMTSYNPVYHFGEEKFFIQAKKAGVDGVIIPDLPPEEGKTLIRLAQKHGLAAVFFLAPTTTLQRLKKVVQVSTGFIYYVSVTGITGQRQAVPSSVIVDVKRAKKFTKKPICVGFGITTPQQVRAIGRVADGVIIGSAIVKEIAKNRGQKDLVARTAKFVEKLAKALR